MVSSSLIALDWGSSHLRAWRLDGDGVVAEQRKNDDGASRLPCGVVAFESALRKLVGDWLEAGMPVMACGMVGSAHGWQEAPYVSCPIDLSELHRHIMTANSISDLQVPIVH